MRYIYNDFSSDYIYLASLKMRSTPGCSHNHKRNMLEINCSTLQFWGHSDNHMITTCTLYKHIKLVRSGLYWVIKGPHVTSLMLISS